MQVHIGDWKHAPQTGISWLDKSLCWVLGFFGYEQREKSIQVEDFDGWWGFADIADIVVPWLEHIKDKKQGVPAAYFERKSLVYEKWGPEQDVEMAIAEAKFKKDLDQVIHTFRLLSKGSPRDEYHSQECYAATFEQRMAVEEILHREWKRVIKDGLSKLGEIHEYLYL